MLPFNIHHSTPSKENQKKKLHELYKYLFIGIAVLVFISYSLHNSLRYFVTSIHDSNNYHTAMEKHKIVELLQQRKIIGSGDSAGEEIEKRSRISSINHLIIVPGHSAIHIQKIASAATSDNSWYLLPYQTNQQFPKIIMSHIRKGLELLEWDESSLLVFSGGQTRNDVGPISEAASYYYVAKETQTISSDMLSRMALEEYARDSYENLLFSICRFKEMIDRYPTKITIVGFDFKKDRFMKMHRAALRFPESAFNYIGLHVNTPGFRYDNALKGENDVLAAFSKDLYGCGHMDNAEGSAGIVVGENVNNRTVTTRFNPTGAGSTALYAKKQARNPFRRSVPYGVSNPSLFSLINICEDMSGSGTDSTTREVKELGQIYKGPLPW